MTVRLATVLHAGAPTALAGSEAAERLFSELNVPICAMRTLLSAGRIQGRLSRLLLGAAPTVEPACEIEEPVLASAAVLDKALWLAGAVFSIDAIARRVRREERAEISMWLPDEARRFALEQRRETALSQRRTLSKSCVYADGRHCAQAWWNRLAPADAVRMALRWRPPEAPQTDGSAAPADPETMASLFVRSHVWLLEHNVARDTAASR